MSIYGIQGHAQKNSEWPDEVQILEVRGLPRNCPKERRLHTGKAMWSRSVGHSKISALIHPRMGSIGMDRIFKPKLKYNSYFILPCKILWCHQHRLGPLQLIRWFSTMTGAWSPIGIELSSNPPPSNCVTLGKWHNSSEPQILHLSNENYNVSSLKVYWESLT